MSETSRLYDDQLAMAFRHGCSVASAVDSHLAAVPAVPVVVGSPSWFYLGQGRELTLRYVPVDTSRKVAGVLLDGAANLRYGLRGQPDRVGTFLQAQVVEQTKDGLRSAAVRLRRQADDRLHDSIAVSVQREADGYIRDTSGSAEVQTVVSAISRITADDVYFKEKLRSVQEMRHLRSYVRVKVNTLLPVGGRALLRQEQADGSLWNYRISSPLTKALSSQSRITLTPAEPGPLQKYDGLTVELQDSLLRLSSGIDTSLTAEYRGGRSPVIIDGERTAVIRGLVTLLTKLPNNLARAVRPLEVGEDSPATVIGSAVTVKL